LRLSITGNTILELSRSPASFEMSYYNTLLINVNFRGAKNFEVKNCNYVLFVFNSWLAFEGECKKEIDREGCNGHSGVWEIFFHWWQVCRSRLLVGNFCRNFQMINF